MMPAPASELPPSAPLIVRLVLDATFECARAIEHVPPPGRGGPIGRLSSAAWTAGHAAATLDAWANDYCAGAGRDPWCVEFSARPHTAPVRFEEAQAAFARVAERSARYLERCDAEELARLARTRPGSFLEGQRVAHVLARAVAHLFVHAGELTVTASLLRRPDLGLPGDLPHSYHAPVDPDPAGGSRALVLRLLLDAREAFSMVADHVPVPAQAGAFERLNSGGWIVGHIAEQDDQYWSVHGQGLSPDGWLDAARVRFGDEASKPPYVEARAALERAFERSTPYLLRLGQPGAPPLDEVIRRSRIPERGEQRIQDLLVLQATHLYALAGELSAIASLAGAPDLDLPVVMRHTIEAAGFEA